MPPLNGALFIPQTLPFPDGNGFYRLTMREGYPSGDFPLHLNQMAGSGGPNANPDRRFETEHMNVPFDDLRVRRRERGQRTNASVAAWFDRENASVTAMLDGIAMGRSSPGHTMGVDPAIGSGNVTIGRSVSVPAPPMMSDDEIEALLGSDPDVMA